MKGHKKEAYYGRVMDETCEGAAGVVEFNLFKKKVTVLKLTDSFVLILQRDEIQSTIEKVPR